MVKLSPIQSPNIEIKTRGKFRYRYISPINPGEPIFGYTLILTILLILSGKGQGKITQIIALGAITAEQVLTVKSAQRRKGTTDNNSTTVSTLSHDNSSIFKPDDDAVVQLKELKYKYESNQISEEEFKDQKQRILSSV